MRPMRSTAAIAVIAGVSALAAAGPAHAFPENVKITVDHSGKCLDVFHQEVEDGTPIVQYTCTSQNSQTFKLIPDAVAPGKYRILTFNGKCLAGVPSTPTARVVQFDCNSGWGTDFYLQDAGYDSYTIYHSKLRGCVGIQDASNANEQQAILGGCSAPGVLFTIETPPA